LRALFFALVASVTSCSESSVDARRGAVVDAMVAADQSFIRARPQLVAGKYARMASDLYGYYRGSVPVYAHDAHDGRSPIARDMFTVDTPLVQALGDAHPENFGTLWASDDSVALEPNDFDAADLLPFRYDLRRLTTGMVIAAHVAQVDATAHRSIAREVAASYRAAMNDYAQGAAPVRVTDATDPILADVFKRARRDRKDPAKTLEQSTALQGTTRTLRRGVLDPADPNNVYEDLPSHAFALLPSVIAEYRKTLVDARDDAYFTVLDAVRELGSGVASWPKIRGIILLRGPSDDPNDDVLLEIKELGDSGSGNALPPTVFFDDVRARVLFSTRRAWGRPDAEPLWGTSTWVGLPVQLRLESEGNKTVRTSRMTGKLGTPEALTALSHVLGGLLARVHASYPASGAQAIARAMNDGFADEEADVAVKYADVVVADYQRFKDALADLGPTLGVPYDPADQPSGDVAALIGP
jgi:uncharacterized protein (DUF2252 family)